MKKGEISAGDEKILQNVIAGLSRLSNPYSEAGLHGKTMAKYYNHIHRTEQSNIMRILSKFIHEVAGWDDSKDKDLRNEAAIDWARKVNEIDRIFPYI
jgi:hypothetical protein